MIFGDLQLFLKNLPWVIEPVLGSLFKNDHFGMPSVITDFPSYILSVHVYGGAK
jgi:hypothetical protein